MRNLLAATFTALVLTVACGAAQPTTLAPACQEDMPCWDSATMGNGVGAGDPLAPEACGPTAAVCIVGHLPCSADCWHARVPADGGQVAGVLVTAWASEAAYQADAESAYKGL